MVNSPKSGFNGLYGDEAKTAVINALEKVGKGRGELFKIDSKIGYLVDNDSGALQSQSFIAINVVQYLFLKMTYQ